MLLHTCRREKPGAYEKYLRIYDCGQNNLPKPLKSRQALKASHTLRSWFWSCSCLFDLTHVRMLACRTFCFICQSVWKESRGKSLGKAKPIRLPAKPRWRHIKFRFPRLAGIVFVYVLAAFSSGSHNCATKTVALVKR